MAVYASSSDQVLLGLLWAVRDLARQVSEPLLGQIFGEFQRETGMILYGPVEADDDAAFQEDLSADLASLQRRGLIARTVNPHARVTTLGVPIASALRLAAPLDALVTIARDKLGVSAAAAV